MAPDIFLSALTDMMSLAEELKKTKAETLPYGVKRWFAELEGHFKPEWGIKAEGADQHG